MLRIPQQLMRRFGRDVFEAAGSSAEEAGIVADHLVEASLMGHDSHGVIRISKYVDWVRAGQVLPNQHVEIVNDRGALLVVDGGFGFGQVIGKEAMELAADRAARMAWRLSLSAIPAISAASAHGPSCLARRGLASIHFVNTSGFGILVAPHGGSDRRLSANPIAAGVAGRRPRPRSFSTSRLRSIAEGKIQVARNKGEKLPSGMVLDGHGRPDDGSGGLLCRSAGRDLAVRRPQGLGPVVLLRGPGGLADRRLRQPSRISDGRRASSTTCCRSCSIPRLSAARRRSRTTSRAWPPA